MECMLRVGDWTVRTEVDDPSSPDWNGIVVEAGEQLRAGECSVAWLGPNGEAGRTVQATVEPSREAGGMVLHGHGALQ